MGEAVAKGGPEGSLLIRAESAKVPSTATQGSCSNVSRYVVISIGKDDGAGI